MSSPIYKKTKKKNFNKRYLNQLNNNKIYFFIYFSSIKDFHCRKKVHIAGENPDTANNLGDIICFNV